MMCVIILKWNTGEKYFDCLLNVMYYIHLSWIKQPEEKYFVNRDHMSFRKLVATLHLIFIYIKVCSEESHGDKI